ncbi:MAG: hypothetical protein WC790_00365 [Candidatus Paceibacterota bacterium]
MIANNVTAGSVVPMAFSLTRGGRDAFSYQLHSVELKKSQVIATLASFTLHLFKRSPVVINGDNGALAVANLNNYVGTVPLDLTTGGILIAGTEIVKTFPLTLPLFMDAPEKVVYGLLAANAIYVPPSAEVYTIRLGVV